MDSNRYIIEHDGEEPRPSAVFTQAEMAEKIRDSVWGQDDDEDDALWIVPVLAASLVMAVAICLWWVL